MAENKRKYAHIASDMIFSIAGVVVLNAVIQLFIYPSFNRTLGADRYGDAITVMSMVAVVGIGFGIGLNYSRMVMSTKKRDVKGDYNIFLLIAWALCVPAAYITGRFFLSSYTFVELVLIYLLMIVTVTRYYSDAEYKLNMNFKRYFVFYLCITLGYCAGMPVFFKTGNWFVPMIVGEVAATAYTAIRGRLYKDGLLRPSEFFRDDLRSGALLSLSYVADTLIQNADRLLLSLFFKDGSMVTTFYNSALIGKVVALLTTSLNSVLIGYLSKFEGKLTKKFFNLIAAALLVVGALATAACFVVSHIFIKLFYPDLYEACRPYFLIANAGQILYFISSTILVVVLRFAPEKYQTYINVLYAALYLAVVPAMTLKFEIWGLAVGILIVNLLKYAIVYVIGVTQLGKRLKERADETTDQQDFDVFVR
ncbi:MAG: hypothetical protein IJL26_07545 [Clostridia bacterium]|nr:hypothetical protein [Clostridia bacterium]